MASHDHDFHIPSGSIWPPLSCLGVGILAFGLLFLMHTEDFGMSASFAQFVMVVGLVLTVLGVARWFGILIAESRARGFKKVPEVLEIANRYGMAFFIVSEMMFFAAFFAAHFYLRGFQPVWPPENILTLAITLPTINTLLLLTSGATLTVAHHALLKGHHAKATDYTKWTYLIGFVFLALQMYEYDHALFGMDSGVYGATFYMLTGFHGFHVLVGSLMLLVLQRRMRAGDFTSKHHFYFEASAWYWHFVDAVWLGLYIAVYLL